MNDKSCGNWTTSGPLAINQKADDATLLGAARDRLARIEGISNFASEREDEHYDAWRAIQDLAQQGVLLLDVFLERHEDSISVEPPRGY